MDILNSYIELIYGFEVKDPYVINQITRVIGYLKDNNYKDDEIMHYLLHNGPVISEILFNNLTDCVPYVNNELMIESKAPIWHPEKGEDVSDYYREPRCNFTMNDLLDLYYTKLKVPAEIRDVKRDVGAFNHLLDKYKMSNIPALDFIITMLKLAEEDEANIVNPLQITDYSQKAYEILTNIREFKAPIIKWRDK